MATTNGRNSLSQLVEQTRGISRQDAEAHQLSAKDIHSAWELLSPAGRDEVSKQELADTLRLFYPELSMKRVRELAGPGPMTEEKLQSLLSTPVKGFDPVAEAFKLLDVKGTGYIDEVVFRRLFLSLPGIVEVSDEDLSCIMELADSDKDGKISLQDFCKIGQYGQQGQDGERSQFRSTSRLGQRFHHSR